jgi:hypothetical protein
MEHNEHLKRLIGKIIEALPESRNCSCEDHAKRATH